MRKPKLVLILLVIGIGRVDLAFAQGPQMIRAGFTTERELGGADRHSYEVNLNKGQALDLVVEQRGVDVVVNVFTADGKFYDRIDSPNDKTGDEPIRMVSPNGGQYRIEINRFNETSPSGKHFIKTVQVRKATDAELSAERLKGELLKIIAEDSKPETQSDTLDRHYLDKASYIDAFGSVLDVPTRIEALKKNPFKPQKGDSLENEFSEAKIEVFGDTAVMSVRRRSHYKYPSMKEDSTYVTRVGYVFKRVKGEWRIAQAQRTNISRVLTPVKLDAQKLDTLTGVYGSADPSDALTITREGNVLYGKNYWGFKFELIPESDSVFYAGSSLSIAFIRDSNGTATQAVIKYALPADRMVIAHRTKEEGHE
jgi:ketosteroid isomerase-like protein